MRLRYFKIDAFTRPGSSGNPAACVYLQPGEVLGEADMLRVAREHKGFVSEMAFCTPLEDGSFKLRYYSSECEVDFCGHATIACMYNLLGTSPELAKKPELTIHTSRGSLSVYNELSALDAVFIMAPEPEEKPVLAKPAELAWAMGVSEADFSYAHPIRAINAGLTTLIVPMTGLQSILALRPDLTALRDFCLRNDLDIILVFSRETVGAENIMRTRVFAPKFGYLEDTATGSGNSAFGYYMLQLGLWSGGPVSIEQNGEPEHYNLVRLKTLDGKVLFGGGGLVRIDGHYILDTESA